MTGCVQSRVALDPSAPLVYPVTSTVAQVDELHGVKIADPYRWLEDDQSPRTREWVAEQNRVTFDYLGSIPQREAIQRRLRELWNYERYGVPFQRGGEGLFRVEVERNFSQ